MENLVVKKITLEDIDQLQSICKKTFIETFAASNTEDNLMKYLEDKFSLSVLKSELENQYSEFYFAIYDNDIAGYLKLNYAESQTELKDSSSLEIERIYIAQDYQGKKIGNLLYQKVLDIAREKQLVYIWLGVWEENLKAINFYKKNGFVEFDKHIFRLGDDEQTDIMMRLMV